MPDAAWAVSVHPPRQNFLAVDSAIQNRDRLARQQAIEFDRKAARIGRGGGDSRLSSISFPKGDVLVVTRSDLREARSRR